MKNTILLVEDEKPIRTMLQFALEKKGYRTLEAENWFEAQAVLENKPLDLILMDWMLPDISGIEIVQKLKQREQLKHIPIIMLTARSEESYKIKGLDSGADVYITKPFSPHELLARIQAVLRRGINPQHQSELLELGPLRIDLTSHEVTLNDNVIVIGPTEFRLLVFLIENPNRVFSRESLLNQVWSRSKYVEERTVDVHILRLRKALATGKFDRYIETVRGIGYRFSSKAFQMYGVATSK